MTSSSGPDESTLKERPSLTRSIPTSDGADQIFEPVAVSNGLEFPVSGFMKAKLDTRKRRMPQCIAHRGYNAKFPENTLLAFDEAVKSGAMALETDVHLTKDGTVVLSHDPTLQRCFGRKESIIDCLWDDIKGLKTLASPHESMPRLFDLLDYVQKPGLEHIWILLDIKLDNHADDVMRLLASTLDGAKASSGTPWRQRVVLGVWAAKYLPLAAKYLPGYPVAHIGLRMSTARQFWKTPNVGFNMLIPILIGPGGKKFVLESQKKHERQVLAWTVNSKERMEWCIRRGLDGVITDDPALFKRTCEEFDESAREPFMPGGILGCLDIIRVYFVLTFLLWYIRRRQRPSPASIRKGPE